MSLIRALLASTAVAGLGFAGAAQAQTNFQTSNIGTAQSVVYGGGSTLAFPTYTLLYEAYSDGDPSTAFNWTGKGSGNSQCAFINNDEAVFFAGAAGQNVDLVASDGFLSAAQIDVFNNGYTGTGPQAGTGPTCVTTSPDTLTSIMLTYPTTAPKSVAGPIIQLPTFGTPVTIPFNVDGVRNTNITVKLTDAQLCGIFSGAITTFGDSRLAGSGLQTAANSATTIHPTYRLDGSGTSFLFTQHLKAVCTAANSTTAFYNNLQAKAPTTTFATLFTNGGGTVPPSFLYGSGSSRVVAALGFSPNGTGAQASGVNAIGYLSPDFTSIASTNGSKTFPSVAEVKNAGTGEFVQPTVSATAAGLYTATPPSTTGTGPGTVTDPSAYVPSIPNPSVGYPIVGYTTYDLPQCFADANKAGGIIAYLGNIYTASTNTLAQNGFAQLTTNFYTVINANILNQSSALVDIEDPTLCTAAGGSTYAGR